MQKVVLWDEYIGDQFVKESKTQFDLLLKLLEFLEEKKISNKLSYDFCDSANLWEWLGSKEQIELRDIKKELSIKINKAEKMSKEEYDKVFCNIGKLSEKKVLVLSFDNKNAFYIAKISDYYNGLRYYLCMDKKAEFCKDVSECFSNIYFDENISSTMNSLNRNFEELRNEIVEHLSKIDEYHSKFVLLISQNKSNQDIAHQFSMDTGIDCSPQAGRDGIKELKLVCYNEISKQEEVVKCELHTKFKKYNVDRTKQDRIYFFLGRPGIKDGKIIVKHIGKHL